MRIFLKIKIKSLAAEARFIRLEELKRRVQRLATGIRRDNRGRKVIDSRVIHRPSEQAELIRWNLWQHRTQVLRKEARASQIAYGFLRGRPYATIEQPKEGNEPDWEAVDRMVKKFGTHNEIGGLDAWKKGELTAPAVAS